MEKVNPIGTNRFGHSAESSPVPIPLRGKAFARPPQTSVTTRQLPSGCQDGASSHLDSRSIASLPQAERGTQCGTPSARYAGTRVGGPMLLIPALLAMAVVASPAELVEVGSCPSGYSTSGDYCRPAVLPATPSSRSACPSGTASRDHRLAGSSPVMPCRNRLLPLRLLHEWRLASSHRAGPLCPTRGAGASQGRLLPLRLQHVRRLLQTRQFRLQGRRQGLSAHPATAPAATTASPAPVRRGPPSPRSACPSGFSTAVPCLSN